MIIGSTHAIITQHGEIPVKLIQLIQTHGSIRFRATREGDFSRFAVCSLLDKDRRGNISYKISYNGSFWGLAVKG